jgi:hypothetical protein
MANHLLYSNQLNQYGSTVDKSIWWGQTDNPFGGGHTILTMNTIVGLAPGGANLHRIVADETPNIHMLQQYSDLSAASGDAVFSCYAKVGTYGYLALQIDNNSANFKRMYACFRMNAGGFITDAELLGDIPRGGSSIKLVDSVHGIYRLSVCGNFNDISNNTLRGIIFCTPNTNTKKADVSFIGSGGTAGVHVGCFQIESGLTPGTYTNTTNVTIP